MMQIKIVIAIINKMYIFLCVINNYYCLIIKTVLLLLLWTE